MRKGIRRLGSADAILFCTKKRKSGEKMHKKLYFWRDCGEGYAFSVAILRKYAIMMYKCVFTG